MRKIIALLLGVIMVFSLSSCQNSGKNTNENNETDIEISENNFVYKSIVEMYRKAVNILPEYSDEKNYADELKISADDEDIFTGMLYASYLFYDGCGREDKSSPHYKLSYGYATKDLNKDGTDELVLLKEDHTVIAIFSFADKKPVLLCEYKPRGVCKIDSNGMLHVYGNNGASNYSHTVYKILDGGAGLEAILEFGVDGYEWTEDGAYYTTYYKTVDGIEESITEQEYRGLTAQYGYQLNYNTSAWETQQYSGLKFIPLYEKGDIAMEIYDAAIEEKIYVVDSKQKNKKISECLISYNYYKEIELSQASGIKKAVLDFDGDGINEMIITAADGGSVILRYEGVRVYIYSVAFRNLDYLNTDGSFSWNVEEGANRINGSSRLVFENGKFKIRELWRIVNDGEAKAEYYIDGAEVTQARIQEYIGKNTKAPAEYSPLKASWVKAISYDDALKIASDYWGIFAGDTDEETGYKYALVCKKYSADSYFIDLMWLVENTNYSTLDTVEIDTQTGEIIAPEYEGK